MQCGRLYKRSSKFQHALSPEFNLNCDILLVIQGGRGTNKTARKLTKIYGQSRGAQTFTF